MEETGRVIFTEEMKRDYTILIPMMLPIHFSFLEKVFINHGYHAELLKTDHDGIKDEGLQSVHNDTCYPALLVIGQFLDALKSGKYDPDKTALLITQTGGGCRASNYIHLLRKALRNNGFSQVPVVSLNFAGMEKNPGFKISLPMLVEMGFSVMYGDLLMLLANQTRPYELEKGATNRLVERWVGYLASTHGALKGRKCRARCAEITRSFAELPLSSEQKKRVGIVGEIYIKYAPLGNNNLERFLLDEDTEPVVPGLLDFLLFCAHNPVTDYQLYKTGWLRGAAGLIAEKALAWLQKIIIRAVESSSGFRPCERFSEVIEKTHGIIGQGAKMGEGWLLTAEMIELIEAGTGNIVCAQPFGCLPNHIVGKGMIRRIREAFPEANIVAIDYDPGATKINQENRIKLMLANAK